MLTAPAALAQNAPQSPQLTATFLQLWSDHRDWSAQQWQTLFQNFSALNLKELYVQWTLYDNISYAEPVETIMRLAQERGMRVHLGLAFHSSFWQSPRTKTELRSDLSVRREQSLKQARDLAELYRSHPAFAGFYIPEEVDESMWRDPELCKIFFDHLKDLAKHVHRLARGKPVSISGYSGSPTDPAQLGEFWDSLLRNVPVDEVLFQDGIGVGHLGIAYVSAYFDAIRSATNRRHRDLRIVVELFRQVDGDFNQKPFRAVAAEFTSLLPQMRAAMPYSPNGLVAFSVAEYLTPEAGEQAAKTFAAYQEWRRTSGLTQ